MSVCLIFPICHRCLTYGLALKLALFPEEQVFLEAL